MLVNLSILRPAHRQQDLISAFCMVLLPLGLVALILTFVNGVIIDDTSDLLVYSNQPAWETASASQPARVIKWAGNSRGEAYGGTWHESLTYKSTMKFTFTGTSISCYGIVARVWDSTRIGFSIDGGTETIYSRNITDFSHQENSAEDFDYGVQLFTATNLSPTNHTLVLTGYLKSAFFGFDYLEYTPVDVATTTSAQSSSSQTTSTTQTTGATTSTPTNSTSTSTSTSTPASSLPPISISAASVGTIDDLPTIPPSDPRILYSLTQQWASSTSCSLSSMVTASSGAFFSFNFTGPAIWIYTATNFQGGKYRVSIDGTEKGFANTAGSTCNVEASFHIGELGNSMHTLVVTNTNTSGSANSSGEIDFVGLRLISSEDQSAVGSTSQQGGGSSKAAITGGVIGGVAVLVLLAFWVYWYLRRKRNDPSRVELIAPKIAQPFSLPEQPYTMPPSEKRRLAASRPLTPSSEQTSRIAYRAYAKHTPPGWIRSPAHENPSENENSTASYATQVSSPQEQQDLLDHSTAPPSLPTPPLKAQYQHGDANDARFLESSTTFNVAPNDGSHLFWLLPEEGDTSGSGQLNSAPPYLEDVLARTDARNLSESDVDMIARRLAEVMRINNAARGGPGLLRGAPPRELIDRLVEEHLDAREDIS